MAPDSNSAERLSARPVRIDDRGILPLGLSDRNSGVFWSSLPKSTRCDLVGQPDLLQHDRHLHAVRRRQRIELQAVGMLGRPARGDRKGGKVGHHNSFFASVSLAANVRLQREVARVASPDRHPSPELRHYSSATPSREGGGGFPFLAGGRARSPNRCGEDVQERNFSARRNPPGNRSSRICA